MTSVMTDLILFDSILRVLLKRPAPIFWVCPPFAAAGAEGGGAPFDILLLVLWSESLLAYEKLGEPVFY